MLDAILSYTFMQHALIAAVLSSVLCGIIGVVIVEKKMIMLSGGIAHTAYGGVGLGYLLGIEPLFGAMAFALGAAFGIGAIEKKGGSLTDVAISLFWSLGMALGITFVALTPGYPPNLDSYLFGSILSVSTSDLILLAAVTLLVFLAFALFFDDWKSYLFDPGFARVSGMKTTVFRYALPVIVSLSVVALIRISGIILVLALLTAPAASASLFTYKLSKRMIIASLLGIAFCFAGLWISYTLNVASGASIVLVSVAFYAISALAKHILRLAKKGR